MARLGASFYQRPCLAVAEDLIGKVIVFRTSQGEKRLRITQTEAYCGEDDTACHAHKGKTGRTWVMYERGGMVYLYLCYGIHWMLNVVTGEAGHPEAVLIRACEGADGPGKLTRVLGLNGTYNGHDLLTDPDLWIEEDGFCCEIQKGKRIGIGFASQEDQDRLWRFIQKTR